MFTHKWGALFSARETEVSFGRKEIMWAYVRAVLGGKLKL